LKQKILSYDPSRGWSEPLDATMDSGSTLVLVFGASELRDDPEPFDGIRRTFPRSTILGCSTAGEILGTTISDGTLGLAVLRFESTALRGAVSAIASPDRTLEAAESIARSLLAPDLRAVFVLSDGQGVNGTELVNGFRGVFSDAVTVTGGLAGDGDRFERTWVIVEGRPATGFVSAVGLYGEALDVRHGSMGGWDIFGPPRRMTRSEGNVLYELDGRPALDLYKEYLGDRADGLPAAALLFPLSVSLDGSDESVVRTVLAVDERSRSMTFAGDVPQGATAQLMRATFDRLIDGASGAARLALGNARVSGDEILSIAISCVGRRLVLGERAEEELDATLEVLPAGTGQIGFYSYGEISPHASGRCDLHNQTMTLTTLSES